MWVIHIGERGCRGFRFTCLWVFDVVGRAISLGCVEGRLDRLDMEVEGLSVRDSGVFYLVGRGMWRKSA